jgi:hypothetical protein
MRAAAAPAAAAAAPASSVSPSVKPALNITARSFYPTSFGGATPPQSFAPAAGGPKPLSLGGAAAAAPAFSVSSASGKQVAAAASAATASGDASETSSTSSIARTKAKVKPAAPWAGTPPQGPATPAMELPTTGGLLVDAEVSDRALKNVPIHHSETEVKDIAAKSELKSEAKSFIPAFMLKSASSAGAPASQTLAAILQRLAASSPTSAQPESVVLCDVWSLLYMDRPPTKAELFDPYPIYNFNDVPTFWRVLNNIPPPSRQNVGCSYYLFREGVPPRWEHDRNKGGGTWTMQFTVSRRSEVVDSAWERLCCQVVGEDWPEHMKPTINGIVCKIRNRNVTLQVWVSEHQEFFPKEIFDRAMQDLVSTVSWDYESHEKAAERSAALAKAKEDEKKDAPAEAPSKKDAAPRKPVVNLSNGPELGAALKKAPAGPGSLRKH